MTDALTHTDAFFPEVAKRRSLRNERIYSPHIEKMRQCVSMRQCEADQLLVLASAVGRLSPSHRDPERFHMDKGEIIGELRRLARNISGR